MSVLVWESPRGRIVMPLEERLIVVGREAHSDLQLDAPSVSGRHALIEVRDGVVRLTDLKSAAGTRINGAQITPEMPSTIEPGDFVHFGDVMVTLLRTPPPLGAAVPTAMPVPAPKARVEPKPKPVAPKAPAAAKGASRAPSPAAPRPLRRRPELWVGGAALLGGVVVAAVFLFGNGDGAAPGPPKSELMRAEPPPHAELEQATPKAAAPDTRRPETEPLPEPRDPDPKPDATAAIPRAQAGALPPDAAADAEPYPYLLELDDGSFRPVRVRDWNEVRVECVGGDGYLYEVDRERIESVQSRGVLQDLARQRLTGMLPSAIEDRLRLAHWCARRHLQATGLRIVNRILGPLPDHAEARKLKQALEGGR
ncbi:MAG: FHA domain-containing protein [Planctomycetota bacterium]|nr:FHA domain-containing protein [Planctomycetota bacterium]